MSAENRMLHYLEQIGSGKKVKVFPGVLKGQPVMEILEFQKDRDTDLIVISSLYHEGLAEYFTGSVARNVLTGTARPLLLTKS